MTLVTFCSLLQVDSRHLRAVARRVEETLPMYSVPSSPFCLKYPASLERTCEYAVAARKSHLSISLSCCNDIGMEGRWLTIRLHRPAHRNHPSWFEQRITPTICNRRHDQALQGRWPDLSLQRSKTFEICNGKPHLVDSTLKTRFTSSSYVIIRSTYISVNSAPTAPWNFLQHVERPVLHSGCPSSINFS